MTNDDNTITGTDAIPNDLVDSPHGEMPLEYTLQNFNALVSANTAMTSELANLNTIIVDLRDRLKDETEARKTSGIAFSDMSKRYDEVCVALTEQRTAAESKIDDLRNDGLHYRKTISALEQKLQRTFGYVDRVLEQEQSYEKQPSIEAKPMVPVKGPAVNDIVMPQKPSRSRGATAGDPDYGFTAVRAFSSEPSIPFEVPRRY